MKRMRKTLWTLLRLAIGLGIIAFLLARIDRRQIVAALNMAAQRWPWLLVAHLILFGALMICLVRWKLILNTLNLNLSWGRAFAIFFIGHFFNTFMPGGTGGDLLKAYYTARETAHLKTEAVASIFIDRVTGLIAMIFLVSTMIFVRYRFFLSHPDSLWAGVLVLVLFAGATAFFIVFFRAHIFADGRWQARFQARPRLAKIVAALVKAYDSFYACRRQPALLVRTVLLSLVNQFIGISAAYCVGRALGLTLPFIDFVTLMPIVAVIASLPITPGGLGVREGVSIQLFKVLGVAQAQALLLSFLPYLSSLLWGAVGGVIFLFYSSGARPPTPAELQAES
jgi:uncharacterized protein (TIRG00374 family)